MKEYFGLGYMQAPNTIYEEIYQVNPGELIKISKEGIIVKEVLCDFSASLNSSSELENNKAIEFDALFGKSL